MVADPMVDDASGHGGGTDRWQVDCYDVAGRGRSVTVSAGGTRVVLGFPACELASLTCEQTLILCMRLVSAAKVAWQVEAAERADSADESWSR